MKRHYLIGGIAGAIAVTAIGATAGYKMIADENPATADSAVECRDVVVQVQETPKDPDRIAGTVTGAVVGGVVGHQVGGGSGKDAATVAGAVAGGFAGNKIQKDLQEKNVREEVRRICE